MIPVIPKHRVLLAGAVVVHAWLVWSVAAQPFDGSAPPAAPRFATARLHFDAVHWPGPGADFFALYHAGVQVRRGLSPYDQQEDPRATPYFFRYIYSPLLAETLGRLVTLFRPNDGLSGLARRHRRMPPGLPGCVLAPVARYEFEDCRLDAVASQPAVHPRTPHGPVHVRGRIARAPGRIARRAIRSARRTRACCSAPHDGGAVEDVPIRDASCLRSRSPRVAGGGWCDGRGLVHGDMESVRERRVEYLAAFTLAADINGPYPGALSLLQAVFVIVSAATGLWLPRAFAALPLIVMVLLLAWTAWVVLRARRHDVVTGSAVLLLAFFLAFLHVWEHHYSAVLLAGVFLLDCVAAERREHPASMPLLLIALAVIAAPSPFALVSRDPQAWMAGTWLLMATSKAVPAVVVFVIGMRALSAQPPTA